MQSLIDITPVVKILLGGTAFILIPIMFGIFWVEGKVQKHPMLSASIFGGVELFILLVYLVVI